MRRNTVLSSALLGACTKKYTPFRKCSLALSRKYKLKILFNHLTAYHNYDIIMV